MEERLLEQTQRFEKEHLRQKLHKSCGKDWEEPAVFIFYKRYLHKISISIFVYLTIIPRARMGSESAAYEAIDSETIRALGIIVN